jgi:hypothetical protein
MVYDLLCDTEMRQFLVESERACEFTILQERMAILNTSILATCRTIFSEAVAIKKKIAAIGLRTFKLIVPWVDFGDQDMCDILRCAGRAKHGNINRCVLSRYLQSMTITRHKLAPKEPKQDPSTGQPVNSSSSAHESYTPCSPPLQRQSMSKSRSMSPIPRQKFIISHRI